MRNTPSNSAASAEDRPVGEVLSLDTRSEISDRYRSSPPRRVISEDACNKSFPSRVRFLG